MSEGSVDKLTVEFWHIELSEEQKKEWEQYIMEKAHNDKLKKNDRQSISIKWGGFNL